MSKVYCEECYYYDWESYFGSDCSHPDNKRVHIKDTYLEKQYGYLWYCFQKNKHNDCALYLDEKAERDRKCIFKRIGRKIRG